MVKKQKKYQLFCSKGKTVYQRGPAEKLTPLTLISNVASFAKFRDATSTLLALKDQNIQIYQYFYSQLFLKSLLLLIHYQDAVLELE